MTTPTNADAMLVVRLVYGEVPTRFDPAELSAARRILAHRGMSIERVRLVMTLVGSSPHWNPIVQTVEKLELHLAKLLDLLSRDQSAPGNRAQEAAYHPHKLGEGEQPAASEVAQQNAAKVAAAQQPWRDLIDEALGRGLRGPAMSRWVAAERGRRMKGQRLANGKIGDGTPAFDVDRLIPGRGGGGRPLADQIAKPAPKAEPRTDVPLHWSETDAPRETAEEGE